MSKEITSANMPGQIILTIITICLLLLWIPVAYEKITRFEDFQNSIFKQPILFWLKQPVAFFVPIAETITAVLLAFRRTRFWGLCGSFLLMMLFTGFIGMALLGLLDKALCHCGAVISGMNWPTHFLFNCFFLILSAYGIYLTKTNKAPAVSDGKCQGLVGQKTV